MMGRSLTFMGAAALAGLVATAGSAFTASNTVGAVNAGAGTTVVGGYTTTDPQYGPNTANPLNLDSVTFTLDHAATYVAVRTHAGGTWYTNEDGRLSGVHSCTSDGAGEVWTCVVTGTGETIAAANDLHVVATA